MKMEFKQKTEEHLKAQVEHFADKGVDEFSDSQRILLKYSDKLAKITDLDSIPDNFPEELKKDIEENKDKYIEFLSLAKKEEIVFRKENIELYNSKFKSVIDTLKSKISSSENPEKMPEYLGSGRNGSAYLIEVDDKKYAAKFSKLITQANFEIKPLLQARGLENVAQLIAYSSVDGVVIMNLLQGKDVSSFTPENAPEYSDEHIIKLIQKTIELDKNGIVIDPKPSNFMYDTKNGFSILDFHLSGGLTRVEDTVMSLRFALMARNWPRLDYKAVDYEKKLREQSLERQKVEIPMMLRFLTILQERFPKVINDWKRERQEREKNPRMNQLPLIDRNSIQTENLELKTCLEKLELIGF